MQGRTSSDMRESTQAEGLRDRAAAHWRPFATNLGLSDAIFAQLVVAYEEPHRRYHTLDHIVEMLDCLAQSRHVAKDPDAIALAIWFHDCIYDSRAGDGENERMSAERLAELHTDPPSAAAQAMILHSVHHEASDDSDTQLFCDLDLYRLGVDFATFQQHGRNVRAEYAWIDDSTWASGRSRFMQRFLDRPAIYQTDYWRDRLETQARDNLARTVGPPSTC